MPDPHVLYAVTAVVVLGLIAWVVVVLARPATSDPSRPLAGGLERSTGPSADDSAEHAAGGPSAR
jgi:hypothetical protein